MRSGVVKQEPTLERICPSGRRAGDGIGCSRLRAWAGGGILVGMWGHETGARCVAAAGIAVALVLTASAARADQIDGEWCADDGRFMSIEGPRMVTPGGNRIVGDYTRHTFSYVVPGDEPGPGTTTSMRQLHDQAIRVWPEGEAEGQEWRRCSAPSV